MFNLDHAGAQSGSTETAVMLAFCHGDSHQGHSVSEHEAFQGSNFAPELAGQRDGVRSMRRRAVPDRQGAKPQQPERRCEPAENLNQRTFLVHVSKHGKVPHKERFDEIARDLDLIRIDNVRPNFDGMEEMRSELADWHAWTPPYNVGDMPTGWFPTATGCTRFSKQYWQVGKRKGWRGAPQFDPHASTFIEVAFVVWNYFETGDYETKLTIRIVVMPVHDERFMRWGIKKTPFLKHQRAAREACQRIFEILKSAEPEDESVALRRFYESRHPRPDNAGRPDSHGPASDEDSQDHDEATHTERGRAGGISRGAERDPHAPPKRSRPQPPQMPAPGGEEPAEDGSGADVDGALGGPPEGPVFGAYTKPKDLELELPED